MRLSVHRGHPSHSHGVNQRPMRVFDLRQYIRWSLTGEPLEIVDQMHLIVIAECVGDLGPRARSRACPAVECRFEPCNPRVQLRPDADLLGKPAFKLTQAESASTREIADPDLTMPAQDVIRGH